MQPARPAVPPSRPKLTSADYLRQAAARKRAKEDEFAAALLQEEHQIAQQCAVWASEANSWVAQLGIARTYRQVQAASGEVMIKVYENGVKAREMLPREFQREREKLRAQLERQKYRPGAATRLSSDAMPRQPRAQVQEELRELLRDTTALTERLQHQLSELTRRGWNVT